MRASRGHSVIAASILLWGAVWALCWLAPVDRAADGPVRRLTGGLVWRSQANQVDAQIEGWPLTRLLERIAAKTRWQVYLEPDTQALISANFKGLTTAQALRRLLGDLNFTLAPSTNGGARLYVYRTTSRAATDLIAAPPDRSEADDQAKTLRDELLVTLKPGAKESIEDLATRLGARIVGRADNLRSYRLKFDDAAAAETARAALAQDADVALVDSNFLVPRPEGPELMANAVPPFTLRPKATADGSRVVVGLIDTALQIQGTVLKDFLLPSVAVAGQATPPAGQPTHGTAMAETFLYGLSRSPEAADGTPVRLLPVDVYGNAENTTSFEIAQGIAAAINGGASIINLSLGGDTDSRLVREVIKAGHDQGIVFLAAAGNEPVTTPTYPAAYPEVIAVTATGRGGQLASYANRGNFVDVAAPGTSVVPFGEQAYVVVGTSTAAANASAAAATLMASTHKTGAALEGQLIQALAPPPTGGAPANSGR